MARSRSRTGVGEKRAAYAVLGLLAAVAVWILAAQSRFNPAVIVAMNHPKGAARIVTGQQATASLTAIYLEGLSGYAALSSLENYGPEALSDKIDGKAELYLASGFQEMSCRAFAAGDAGGARVEAFVYAMESPKDSFAVFSGQRRPGADQLALTANAYATQNALFFARDRFYVELVADRASPELRPALETMAQTLLAALPGEEVSAADTDLFPAEGLKKDSVRLAVNDALGMQGLENVYTADYDMGGALNGAFLAVRASAEEAAAQAETYAAFLAANGFKPLAAPGAPQGARVMAFDTMVQLVMAKGKVLAGVHDAATLEDAMKLASRLEASIGGQTR